MRVAGFVGEVKLKDTTIPAHSVIGLTAEALADLQRVKPDQVFDLTSTAALRIYGGAHASRRMTTIQVVDCPDCVFPGLAGRMVRARLTRCICGGTTRMPI